MNYMKKAFFARGVFWFVFGLAILMKLAFTPAEDNFGYYLLLSLATFVMILMFGAAYLIDFTNKSITSGSIITFIFPIVAFLPFSRFASTRYFEVLLLVGCLANVIIEVVYYVKQQKDKQ